MTVAFSDTNLLCDMLRPLPTLSNKVTVSGERQLGGAAQRIPARPVGVVQRSPAALRAA